MYNHYAVVDPRGLAPVGFHIPTFAEYTTLIEAAQLGTACEAPALRSPSFGGTNTNGFSALDGGIRLGFGQPVLEISEGSFITQTTYFWSSDAQGGISNFIMLASYCSIISGRDTTNIPNNRGAYIRLIKD